MKFDTVASVSYTYIALLHMIRYMIKVPFLHQRTHFYMYFLLGPYFKA